MTDTASCTLRRHALRGSFTALRRILRIHQPHVHWCFVTCLPVLTRQHLQLNYDYLGAASSLRNGAVLASQPMTGQDLRHPQRSEPLQNAQ